MPVGRVRLTSAKRDMVIGSEVVERLRMLVAVRSRLNIVSPGNEKLLLLLDCKYEIKMRNSQRQTQMRFALKFQ